MPDDTTPYHRPGLLGPGLAAACGSRRAAGAARGDGGHAAALRGAGAEALGVHRDPDAMATSRRRRGDVGVQYVEARYAAAEALAAVSRFRPDFILFDLGVSSRQLDDESRGFTFRPGAPLDMRMGRAADTDAAALLAETAERELTRIFRGYADEPRAGRLAREGGRRRGTRALETSEGQ